jgi:hypothetical protein
VWLKQWSTYPVWVQTPVPSPKLKKSFLKMLLAQFFVTYFKSLSWI